MAQSTGTIGLRQGERTAHVDCRSSDAIALALGNQLPSWFSDQVLQAAGISGGVIVGGSAVVVAAVGEDHDAAQRLAAACTERRNEGSWQQDAEARRDLAHGSSLIPV